MITESAQSALPSSLELQGASPSVITTSDGGRGKYGKCNSRSKEYRLAYRLNNKAEIRQYWGSWYQKNKARRKEQQSSYRAAKQAEKEPERRRAKDFRQFISVFKEKLRLAYKTKYSAEYSRKRYHDNPERAKLHHLHYRNRHRESLKSRRRELYQQNKGRCLTKRRHSNLHPLNDPAECCKIYKLATELTRMTGERHCVDHIIPIAHGGWHHHQNLQPLPENVNAKKNANPFWESSVYKDWMDVPEYLWPDKLRPEYEKRCNVTSKGLTSSEDVA